MLGDILLFPVVGPIKGVIKIAEKVAEMADLEIADKSRVTKELTELQVRLDLGQISENEYNLKEKKLLEELEAIMAMERDENEEE